MATVLDTSAVNRLHDDSEREALLRYVASRGAVLVSGLNIIEAARTADVSRRHSLLRVLARLAAGNLPLEIPNALARRAMCAFASRDPALTLSVSGTSEALWDLLCEPDLADETVRAEMEAWHRSLESEFDEVHKDARPHIQALFTGNLEPPRRASAYLRALLDRPGFAYEVVTPLFHRTTGLELEPQHLTELLGVIPEVPAFLLGWAHSVHSRAIARENFGRRNAGTVDLWFGVHATRVSQFVTADRRQYRALRLVARITAKHCAVVRYETFRREQLASYRRSGKQ